MTDINIDLNCLKSIGSELCRVFWRQLRRCHSLAGSLQLLPRIHRRVDNLHWVRAAASRLQSLFRYFRQGGVATEVRHDLLPGNYENPEREVQARFSKVVPLSLEDSEVSLPEKYWKLWIEKVNPSHVMSPCALFVEVKRSAYFPTMVSDISLREISLLIR